MGSRTIRKMHTLEWTALIFALLGGLNWGLVGLFEFDAISHYLGESSILTKIAHTAVGIASIYVALWFSKEEIIELVHKDSK